MLFRLLLEPNQESGGSPGGFEPAYVAGSSPEAPNLGSVSSHQSDVNPDSFRPSTPEAGSTQGSTGGQPQTGIPGSAPALGSGQPAGAGAGNWQSVREAASAIYGYDLSQFNDDRSALAHLIQQAQAAKQRDYYADLGRQIAPRAGEIRQFLSNQQQHQNQPKQRQAWEAPEFDPRWQALVDRDESTGMYLSKPGVDPEIARKVNEYANWRTNFDRNPAEVLNGMVESRAREIARQVSDEQFRGYREQQEVSSILSQNASWLYQTDEQGRPITNPATGRPMASAMGQRYMTHVENLTRSGVTDPATQNMMAKQLLQGELATLRLQQLEQGAAANNPQSRQAVSRPNVNPAQTVEPSRIGQVAGATEPDQRGQSLRDRLAMAFQAEGITDSDFEPSKLTGSS